jgi:hypothetical protein
VREVALMVMAQNLVGVAGESTRNWRRQRSTTSFYLAGRVAAMV